ncbi:MAG: response regulator transcription factor [Candidatus Obscuribacter sp.]|nr:response regulator transcription factor [Candidatus Obscuribacter sp.]
MENKIRVLIAEDQELTSIGLKTILSKQADLDILGIASDGQQAVEMALQVKPDVIVMDIGMPVMNGIDATMKIKELLPETRFLMLTSHRESSQVFAAISAGAQGYCLKEVSIKRLDIALRAVSNGDTWLDPEIARTIFDQLTISDNSRLVSSAQRNKPEAEAGYASTKRAAPNTTLSERELEVLQLLVDGMKNTDIADKLCITLDTVKSHMSKIMDKLSVSDRTQAALKAVREGIVTL